MKRILALALVALVAFSSLGFCDIVTATMGDQNSSNVYRVTTYAGQSGTTNYGYLTFAQDTGIVLPYIATSTTNTTLTAWQTGLTILFGNGTGIAANGTQYTLPAATVGLNYTIVSDVAKFFYVKPASGEIINYLGCSANQRLLNSSAAAGDSVQVMSLTTGQWSVRSAKGTWVCGGA